MECPFRKQLALANGNRNGNGGNIGNGNGNPQERSPSSPLPSSPDSGSQTPAPSMTSYVTEGEDIGPGKRKLNLRSVSEGVAALVFPSVSVSNNNNVIDENYYIKSDFPSSL